MKIVVCIKQVPNRDTALRVNDKSTWIREQDLSFEINEPDAFALEEALQLKEKHGGEVVVCSVGPARSQQTIREALAKGADRAIQVDEDLGASADSFATASLLAAAVRGENPDLILTGLQSDDFGSGQSGVIMAELLGLPHASIIMEVQIEDSKLRVKRELESGWFQWVEMSLPALLTIQSGIKKLRYATLKGIKSAKTKEIRIVKAADLGLQASSLGGRLELHRVYVPVKTKKTELIGGSPKEAAAELVKKLRTEARVL